MTARQSKPSSSSTHRRPVIGTTRMGTDPTTSVMDPDLRLHGHRTVFVVGAGPFPTTGTANPTLTVAALFLRTVGPIRASLTDGG